MFSKLILNLLDEDESVTLLVREYGITKIPVLLLLGLAYCGVFFLLYPLFARGVVGVAIFLALLGVLLWRVVRVFIMWYMDLFIITDERLIDVHQQGIFTQTVRHIAYEDVDDVIYSKRGIWATLLNYGTLTITFTTESAPIQLQHVFEPKTVRDYILYYEREEDEEITNDY